MDFAQRQDSPIAALDHAVRAHDRGAAIGLSRVAKTLRIEVRGNVAFLRLGGGAGALARLQVAIVAVVLGGEDGAGLDDNRRYFDRRAVRSGNSVRTKPGDGPVD
jgi:hypothetical protein